MLFAAGAVFSTGVLDSAIRSPSSGVDFGVRPVGPRAGGAGADDDPAPYAVRPLPTDEVGLAAVTRLVRTVPVGTGTDTAGSTPPSGPDTGSETSTGTGQTVFHPAGPAPATERPSPRPAPAYAEPEYAEPEYAEAARPDRTAARPSPALTVALPDVRIPPIEVPAAVAMDVPGVGSVMTPRVAVSDGEVRLPQFAVTARNGTVGVAVREGAVVAPEVVVDPARLSPSRIVGPDLTITDDARDTTRLAVRGAAVSENRAVTPDVQIGRAGAVLPDAALPEPTLPDLDQLDHLDQLDRLDEAVGSSGGAVERLVHRP